MERLTEMKEYILPKWNERFNKDISKVQTDYNRNRREILLKFCNYLDNNLISMAKDHISFEKQGEQLFLVISYLHHFTTYANRYIDAKAAVSVPL